MTLARRIAKFLLTVLLYAGVLALIAASLWLGGALQGDEEDDSPSFDTRPQSPLSEPAIALVEPTSTSAYTITAYGRVRPSRELELRPQVEGRILFLHPQLERGGRIAEGEVLWQIDASDAQARYDLARAERRRAEGRLLEEQGLGRAAAREWELLAALRSEVSAEDRSLALREPHLAQAEAEVDARVAEEALAAVQLERCTERAPFDAVVLDESIEVGVLAEVHQTVGRLVAADRVQVEVEVPQVAAMALLRAAGIDAAVQPSSRDPRKVDANFLRWLGSSDVETQAPRLLLELPWRESDGLWIDQRIPVHLTPESAIEEWEVPRSAVVTSGGNGGATLYVVRKGTTQGEATPVPLPVDITRESITSWFVTGNLTAGDRIVSDGGAFARVSRTGR
ncbi:MAG: hypothetical protein GC161_11305 [Planctomycetaceae bacterium]|nr:hypothetical protein [Planctomycetaceae bacterium]